MHGRFKSAAATALLAVGLLRAAPAQAQIGGERYSLRGFGGWALGDTNNDNQYGHIATGDTEYNNYNFSLNVAAQPSDKVTIRAQALWAEDLLGQRAELDYAFAQWTHSPKLKIRAGKVLSPLGLYTETRNVGTLRPFYLLPDFYSGAAGLLPKAYLGAGLTGTLSAGPDWEVIYDAFGGEMVCEKVQSDMITGFDPSTGLPIVESALVQIYGRNLVGGRVGLGSPARGLQFGAAATYSDIEVSANGGPREPWSLTQHATLTNAYLEYERGPFTLRSELFKAFGDQADLTSGYVEASYKLTRHWQLAGLYDRSSFKPEPTSIYAGLPEQMNRHESIGLALDFWVSPEMVFKLNGYHVKGNLSARPTDVILAAALGRLDEDTNVAVFGVQFSF
jgi:hypothetical protein